MVEHIEFTDDDEDFVDVTERIDVYEKGKAWTCDCGQGIGVAHEQKAVRCASCEAINIDQKASEREEEARDIRQATVQESVTDDEQTSLSEFLG
jgi:hypothetical protein